MEQDPPRSEEIEEEEENDDDEELEDIDSKCNENNYNTLEKNYYKIFREVEGDPAMANFLEHYRKVFAFLDSTREQKMELEVETMELQEELMSNQERLNNSLEIIETDAAHIESLKGEIANSLMMIDNAHTREQSAQEVIDNLRKQIANLNMDIDYKNKMAQGELEENPQMAKHREGLERDKAKLISEVSKLSEKLTNALAYQDELERRTSLTDLRINDISTQLEETEVEVEKFKRNKEKLEADMVEFHEEIAKKDTEIDGYNLMMHINTKLLAKYEIQLKMQTNSANRCVKELDVWNSRFLRMQSDYETFNCEAENLRARNIAAIKSLRTKDEEKVKMQIELTKLVKEREQAEHKSRLMEDEKGNIMDEQSKLKEVVVSMKRDNEAHKYDAKLDKKNIVEHAKQRDILNRNLLRQQAVGRDHMKVIKVQEQVRKKLTIELDDHMIEERKQDKQIFYLKKEKDRLVEDALEKTKKLDATMEEMHQQAKLHVDLKKQLADIENKFKQQQNLFDEVRTDRNALQKALQECYSENNNMRQKLRIMHHQSEQLKEQIGTQEQSLIKVESVKRKIVKEKENIKIELNVEVDAVRSLKNDITDMWAEEHRLNKVVREGDKMIKEHTGTITALMNERDVLGSQLVRRNDEISLVKEKVKIIQLTLHHGEAQYDERLSDIKLLKVEIKRLRLEKALMKKSISSMNDFKVEVFHLERDLTKERMKTRALEDELQEPMNIHRWRKLDGTDPEPAELFRKLSLLQKRIIGQASSMIYVEKTLGETEKLYMNLRVLLSKQPDAVVQSHLNKTQKCLFASTKRSKCLVSELNMFELYNRQCSINLEHTHTELVDVTRKLKTEQKKNKKDAKSVLVYKKMLNTVHMPPIPGAGDGYSQALPSLSVTSIGSRNFTGSNSKHS